MSAGKHLRQHAVGVGGRAVLAGQRRLPRPDGGYRRSGLFRHRFNLFVVPRWLASSACHSGRRIATLVPSGLIRTEAPE